MANLPSSFSFVNDVEVAQDAPVTEGLFVKLGSNTNYLREGLDAEIAARIAADTDIVGAGPYQTNTQLKSRLDGAKTVDLLSGGVTKFVNGDLGWSGTNLSTPANVFVRMSTNYIVTRWDLVSSGGLYWIRGAGNTIAQTNNFDSTIAVTATRIPVLTWDSTIAQFVFTLRIWEIASV